MPVWATAGRSSAGQSVNVVTQKGDPMKKLFLFLIRFYQKHISPAFPPRCRYMPTCSAYAYEAITKYGALKGGWLTVKRLCTSGPVQVEPSLNPQQP